MKKSLSWALNTNGQNTQVGEAVVVGGRQAERMSRAEQTAHRWEYILLENLEDVRQWELSCEREGERWEKRACQGRTRVLWATLKSLDCLLYGQREDTES